MDCEAKLAELQEFMKQQVTKRDEALRMGQEASRAIDQLTGAMSILQEMIKENGAS